MSVVKSCVKCKDCYVLDYGTVCSCLDEMIPRDVDINKEVYDKCPKIGIDTSNEYWKELVQLRKENEFLIVSRVMRLIEKGQKNDKTI